MMDIFTATTITTTGSASCSNGDGRGSGGSGGSGGSTTTTSTTTTTSDTSSSNRSERNDTSSQTKMKTSTSTIARSSNSNSHNTNTTSSIHINSNNKMMSVRVGVRVRPYDCNTSSDRIIINCIPVQNTIELKGSTGKERKALSTSQSQFPPTKFIYDTVFDEKTTQLHLYNTISESLLQSVIDGYNATIMAYGQTGSGKTHTILGSYQAPTISSSSSLSPSSLSPSSLSSMPIEEQLSEDCGLIPRFMKDLFEQLEEKKTKCSTSITTVPTNNNNNTITKSNKEQNNQQQQQQQQQQQLNEQHSHFDYEISATFLEVYGEDVYDLLGERSPTTTATTTPKPLQRNRTNTTSTSDVHHVNMTPLRLREETVSTTNNHNNNTTNNNNKKVVCVGLTEHIVTNVHETIHVLQRGMDNRTTASTAMNHVSSRSHGIFTITLKQIHVTTNVPATGLTASEATTIETPVVVNDTSKQQDGENATSTVSTKKEKRRRSSRRLQGIDDYYTNNNKDSANVMVIVSQFTFVDLAGSERSTKTGCVGQRAKEGIQINQGLLALGNVIHALASKEDLEQQQQKSSSKQQQQQQQQHHHIPYRDSKLTRLLQDALGGNSQTYFLACVSALDSNGSETISTLQYANRARNIKNAPNQNVCSNQNNTVDEVTMKELKRLKAYTAILQAELVKYKYGTSTTSYTSTTIPSPINSNSSGNNKRLTRSGGSSISSASSDHDSSLRSCCSFSSDDGSIGSSDSDKLSVMEYLKQLQEAAEEQSCSSDDVQLTPTKKKMTTTMMTPKVLSIPRKNDGIISTSSNSRRSSSNFYNDNSNANNTNDPVSTNCEEATMLLQVEGDLTEQESELRNLRRSLYGYESMKEQYRTLADDVHKLEKEKARLANELENLPKTSSPISIPSHSSLPNEQQVQTSCRTTTALMKKIASVDQDLSQARTETMKQKLACRKVENAASKCRLLEQNIAALKESHARLVQKQKEDAIRHKQCLMDKDRTILTLKKQESISERNITKLKANVESYKRNLDRRQEICIKLALQLKETESKVSKLLSQQRQEQQQQQQQQHQHGHDKRNEDNISRPIGNTTSTRNREAKPILGTEIPDQLWSGDESLSNLIDEGETRTDGDNMLNSSTSSLFAPLSDDILAVNTLLEKAVQERVKFAQLKDQYDETELLYKNAIHKYDTTVQYLEKIKADAANKRRRRKQRRQKHPLLLDPIGEEESTHNDECFNDEEDDDDVDVDVDYDDDNSKDEDINCSDDDDDDVYNETIIELERQIRQGEMEIKQYDDELLQLEIQLQRSEERDIYENKAMRSIIRKRNAPVVRTMFLSVVEMLTESEKHRHKLESLMQQKRGKVTESQDEVSALRDKIASLEKEVRRRSILIREMREGSISKDDNDYDEDDDHMFLSLVRMLFSTNEVLGMCYYNAFLTFYFVITIAVVLQRGYDGGIESIFHIVFGSAGFMMASKELTWASGSASIKNETDTGFLIQTLCFAIDLVIHIAM